jgi:hypothetical protein
MNYNIEIMAQVNYFSRPSIFSILKEIKNPIHYPDSFEGFDSQLGSIDFLKDQYQNYMDEIASQIFALKTFLREDPFIDCLERTIFPELKLALDIPICEFEEEFLDKPKKKEEKEKKEEKGGGEKKKKKSKSALDLKLNTLLGIFRSQYDQAFRLNSNDNYHPQAPQIYALVNNIYSIFSQIKKDIINRTFEMKFKYRGDSHNFRPILEPLNSLDQWFFQRMSFFAQTEEVERALLGLKLTAEALRSQAGRLVSGSKIVFSTYESELSSYLSQLEIAFNKVAGSTYEKKTHPRLACVVFNKTEQSLRPSDFLDLNDKLQGSMDTLKRINWIRENIHDFRLKYPPVSEDMAEL